jgi:chromosome segregation ATPase
MNQNQPTTMNTDTPTPETDSAYIQCPNEGAWDFRIRQEKTMAKLERERDEAIQARKDSAADWLNQVRNADFRVARIKRERDRLDDQLDQTILRLGETQERMIDAERQRDRLAEALKNLVESCDCIDSVDFMPASMPEAFEKAQQALQSLTP